MSRTNQANQSDRKNKGGGGPSWLVSLQGQTDFLKALDRCRRAASVLKDPKPASTSAALAVVEKMIKALANIGVDEMVRELGLERERLRERYELELQNRRETLRRSAKDEGWTTQGFSGHDAVGCFRVKYKQERVVIEIGSERLATVVEVDGGALFERLVDLLSGLESFPFSRESFFRSVKEAIAIGRAVGKARDGRVPVRDLYPLVVLSRQNQDGRFLKEPSSKRFEDYPMGQFVYDLARFGREGWGVGSERLVNLPPNMATVAKGSALTLPALEGGAEQQLGAIGVQTR